MFDFFSKNDPYVFLFFLGGGLFFVFVFNDSYVIIKTINLNGSLNINGCGMGPLLVLVSPCFRETVFVTCKIGSFLCSLDNLLQKNVIVFFFLNQISKWRSLENKMAFFLPTFHIF